MPVLQIKPHFSAHVLSNEEVALLGEGGRYALRGKVYAALVPMLDGTRDGDELVALLQDRFPPELVHYALMHLESKGYASPATAGAAGDAADRAWWSAHGVVADIATALLTACSVHLADAGAHPPALGRLRQMLARRYALREAPEAEAIALIATGDYLDDRLAAAVRDSLPRARWVLPTRLAGATLWLGPLIERDGAERFTILLRRLGDNRSSDLAALRHGARFPLLPPQGLPETFDLAGAWIAAAVAAIAAGSPPQALLEGVVTLDPWTLETRRHPITICRASPAPAVTERLGKCAPIELAANPKRYTADGGHRICPPHETLARLEPFVGPIAGVVPDIVKVPTPEGMHVYAATQIFGGEPIGLHANRVLGRPGGACGKGASDLQARVSCIAEAVERYSCGYFADEPRCHARIDLLGERALHPSRLLQFSEAQYRDRETTNAVNGGGYNWVPSPFDAEREIEWTPAWSLTFQRSVWLPTAFCYFRYPVPADHEFCAADSNGCAAGNTLEEAILQGFLELVERDACALWWYNRVCRPGIDLATFDDPFFEAMVAQSDRHGRELVALDLTSDLGIPVVMAVCWRRSDWGRIHLGLGSHLEPRLAVSRALAELNQSAAFDLSNPKGAGQGRAINADHHRWLQEATVENQSHLRPAPGSLKPASEFRNRSTRDLRDDIMSCVEQLSRHSLEMIVVEHTRPDIGFPVVRVVVPGLRHFWPRFAPGRLYDVPVTLGWLDHPLAETELNPIPMFF